MTRHLIIINKSLHPVLPPPSLKQQRGLGCKSQKKEGGRGEGNKDLTMVKEQLMRTSGIWIINKWGNSVLFIKTCLPLCTVYWMNALNNIPPPFLKWAFTTLCNFFLKKNLTLTAGNITIIEFSLLCTLSKSMKSTLLYMDGCMYKYLALPAWMTY